jgi:hypothetical protein
MAALDELPLHYLRKLCDRLHRVEQRLGLKNGSAERPDPETNEAFERLHVQVTQSQYSQLKRLAFERRVSVAELVRQALTEWLPFWAMSLAFVATSAVGAMIRCW